MNTNLMKKKYLEISSIGSACGQMPFEPIERTLLYCWARYAPDDCKAFLISKEYILNDDRATDLLSDHLSVLKNYADNISMENTKTEDFKLIMTEAEKELQQLRSTQDLKVTDTELEEFRINGNKMLTTSYGKNSEETIIKNVNGNFGNSKMYYYYIDKSSCIGGKHDATKDDLILEIKTRMKENNVRKNKYDLYQLFGYLLAMKADRGKIIQHYGNKTFASDQETEREYGIIDIKNYYNEITLMLEELKHFFSRLDIIINNKCMSNEDIQKAFTNKPICTISNGKYINICSKYSKLFNFI